MRLFMVVLTGYGLKLREADGMLVDVGFVKNEVVLAKSETDGSARALAQVRTKLRAKVDEGGLLLNNLDIQVDEVASTLQFWRLAQQEGFVFFRQDDARRDGSILH